MKVCIIGAGHVGSAAAFALLGEVEEIILVDIDIKKLEAEALDLKDAIEISNYNTVISWSNKPENAEVYIFCAGKHPKGDQNRNDFFVDNRKLLSYMMPMIAEHNTDPWMLIVSNPSGELAKECLDTFSKVISCGRMLDVARIKVIGSHESPETFNHYEKIEAGKGHTCWAIASEIRILIRELMPDA